MYYIALEVGLLFALYIYLRYRNGENMKLLMFLLLMLSQANAATVMIIDVPFNLSHREFKDQSIKVYNFDPPVNGSDKHHGNGMFSIVLSGEGLKDKLKTKHTYILCSSYSDDNLRCLELAVSLNVDVVNYSGGGPGLMKREKELMLQLFKKRIKVFAAAGNEGNDITKTKYYPASFASEYSNITAVENVDKYGIRYESSNYAPFTKKYLGVKVMGASFDGKYMLFTGTSPATALATHLYLKGLEK